MCCSTGSIVPSFWSAPSSLEISALRVPRHRLAPVDSFLTPLSPAKLPVSHPFFLSSPGTNFDFSDCCHQQRRSNLLICLFLCNLWNDYVVLFRFHPVTSKYGSWYAGCRALCPGPSSQEDRILAARSKNKRDQLRKKAHRSFLFFDKLRTEYAIPMLPANPFPWSCSILQVNTWEDHLMRDRFFHLFRPWKWVHLKASTYLDNKKGSLCLGWLWASGGLKFWVGLVQEHASCQLWFWGFEVSTLTKVL